MATEWQYPCKDEDCECSRCSHTIRVFNDTYENLRGEIVYPGMCTYLSPPEPFEILATDFEEWQRRNNTKTIQTVSSSSSGFTKDDLNSNPNKHQHRGRRGSGLKGNRTERMVEQLAEFKAWLRDNPVNERDPAKTVGARANTYWLLHEKTMARDAKRTGEKRGFSSAKTLAAAYRNGKA